MSDRYEIEILNIWGDSETYIDFFIFDKENSELAHCCDCYDGDSNITLNEMLISIYKDAYKWFKLPRTSELSEITYSIFEDLCQSENDMIYIEDENDFELYNINPTTYKILCEDIEKFNLGDYFEERGEEIIVYGGLQSALNDDRNLKVTRGKVYLVDKDYINQNIDLYNKKNNSPYDLLILKDNDLYIAIDDSRGECYVEEFDTLEQATYWLLCNELTAEEVKSEKIPYYISKFVIDTTLSKDEDNDYEL